MKLTSYLSVVQTLKTYSTRALMGLLSIVFFANITFAHSIDFHLCQGELQSIAFFGEKATCSKEMKAKMAVTPRSCCDKKKKVDGLVFEQKSCCDHVQIVQDNVLNGPSFDVDQSDVITFDFINDFEEIQFAQRKKQYLFNKVGIPPPPDIVRQHSPENLQVFII